MTKIGVKVYWTKPPALALSDSGYRARNCARSAQNKRIFLFGHKELSQGDEIQAVGPYMQAAGSCVVCFELAHTARIIAHKARKIRANFWFGQKEMSQGNEIQIVGPSLQAAGSGVVCFGLVREQRALLRTKRAK